MGLSSRRVAGRQGLYSHWRRLGIELLEDRRLLDAGSVRVDGHKIAPPDYLWYFFPPHEDIRIGKKRHLRVFAEDTDTVEASDA